MQDSQPIAPAGPLSSSALRSMFLIAKLAALVSFDDSRLDEKRIDVMADTVKLGEHTVFGL